MKTHVLKIFGCILLTVSLTVSFFAIPVSAEGWRRITTSQMSVSLGVTDRDGEIIQGYVNESSYDFPIPEAYNGSTIVAARFIETTFSISAGDVVIVDPLYTGGWLGGISNKIVGYVWSVFDYTDGEWTTRLLGCSEYYEVRYIGGKGYTIDLPATEIPIEFSSDRAALALEIYMERESAANFSMNFSTVSFGYGTPGSPDAPTYIPPNDGNMGSLENIESGLIADSQGGFDSANQTFTDFGTNILQFKEGMVLISNIMTDFVGEVPLVSAVITISLSLGLFASLLGLAGSIVSAADRKASREARAESRRSKNGS